MPVPWFGTGARWLPNWTRLPKNIPLHRITAAVATLRAVEA